jgi:hypothetical protein
MIVAFSSPRHERSPTDARISAPSRSTLLLSFAGSVPDAGQQRYGVWKAIRDKAGLK